MSIFFCSIIIKHLIYKNSNQSIILFISKTKAIKPNLTKHFPLEIQVKISTCTHVNTYTDRVIIFRLYKETTILNQLVLFTTIKQCTICVSIQKKYIKIIPKLVKLNIDK